MLQGQINVGVISREMNMNDTQSLVKINPEGSIYSENKTGAKIEP